MNEPLSKLGIRESSKAFIELNNYLEKLKKNNKHAACIKHPRMPEKISESIVYHMIKDKRCNILGKKKFIDIHFQKKASKYKGGTQQPTDIILELNDGSECLIEVKATQKKFTAISKKDSEADYIIWIDFNQSFRSGIDDTIDYSILKVPHNMKPTKTTWGPYHKKYPSAERRSFRNLDEIIS
tara:strand:- start:950 stop:1498 length:549 start_codon:yes stop_codon:yes gene_type:complete